MEDKINKYFELEKELHNYFGYEEDWKVIPMKDSREYYWFINDIDEVWFTECKDTCKILFYNNCDYDDPKCKTDEIYSDMVYHQRFLPKKIYIGDKYTIVVSDTRIDGNIFLSIFDNSKKILK